MKNKMLIVAIFLLVIIVGTVAVFFVTKTSPNPLEDFIITDGILEKYIGSEGNVVIPKSITNIGNNAFLFCSHLTSVTIPNSVTNIGDNAFLFCDKLKSVIIPVGVMSIGNHAFSECTSLISVTIPYSVKNIGEFAFYGCSNLEKVTIPKSVKEIGDYAFWYCPKVTIYGESGSYAEQYAKENGIPFKAI